MPQRHQRRSFPQRRSVLHGSRAIFLHRARLFSLFGFEVSVDASWLLLAGTDSWTLAGSVFPGVTPGLTPAHYWVMGGFAAAGLFMSIVFHETAHSLVARHYGLPIRGITLFIFGGVAEMTAEPNRPRDELLMAAAGPAASLLLSAICYVLLFGVVAWNGPAAVVGVLWYLALINFILALFNLVPAFPLDGGRIFRAALWSWRGDLIWATRIAAGAGNLFGVFLIVLGLIGVLQGDFVGGIWRFLIGMFLRGAASTSYSDTLSRRLLADIPIARIMNPDPITVPSDVSVQAFIDDYVYRHHHRWFPVVDDGTVERQRDDATGGVHGQDALAGGTHRSDHAAPFAGGCGRPRHRCIRDPDANAPHRPKPPDGATSWQAVRDGLVAGSARHSLT